MAEFDALASLLDRLVDHDPPFAARALEGLAEADAAEAVRALPASAAARVVPHLQPHFAAVLLSQVEPKDFRAAVKAIDPERAATVVLHMPEDARERLLRHIPEKLRTAIRELLSYPEDSVGRIMHTSFLAFHKDEKVRDVVRKIRGLVRKGYPSSYAYVVDQEAHLLGVINMRDLILAADDDSLASIMRTGVFTLNAFAEQAQAAVELSRRGFFAAPVIDNDGRILGIVNSEQLLHGAQEGIVENIQKMVGAGSNERAFSTLGYSLRKRLPWLHVNLATAFLAAAVVAFFEDTIARLTVLAVFLPVVAGQGGNAGAQSLAIVMRGLVMREIPRGRVRRLIGKEALLGAINGTITGGVTALVAWMWYGNPVLGLVVALGMLINLFFAGLAGASIPMAMRAAGLDPAQSSSIILTTVTDVVGFAAFLGLAMTFQSHLA